MIFKARRKIQFFKLVFPKKKKKKKNTFKNEKFDK